MDIRLWLDICVLFVVSKYFHSRQFSSGHVRLMAQWDMQKEETFVCVVERADGEEWVLSCHG